MCSRCGDCIEATNAKTEKEKGPEYWHSIGKVVKMFLMYCRAYIEAASLNNKKID